MSKRHPEATDSKFPRIEPDGGGIALEIETKWVLKHYSQKLKLFFFIDLTGKERILKEEK